MSYVPVSLEPTILFADACNFGVPQEENRDSILHVRIAMGELMVVAAGLGEQAGRAAAARMTVEHFYAHLAALPYDYAPENALRGAAARASASLVAAAHAHSSATPHMGATVVVALLQQDVYGSRAWIGHIGNCRAYLLRVGRLYCLTTDHSSAQALFDRHLLTQDEIRDHPGAAVLVRSLGQQAPAEIEVEQHPLAEGDTLLLCSSGLWRLVPNQEIQEAIAIPGLTVGAAAHNLLELLLAAGGHDDIGIEMARLIQPPAVSLPRQSGSPFAFKWILMLFMLAFTGMCVLVYFALNP
jgi:serine/threonine protein phosphatase PrpC